MSTDTENPWENAASDPNWNQQQQQQQQAAQAANFSMEQTNSNDNAHHNVTFDDTTSPDNDREECASKLVRYLVNSWHLSDLVVGLAMIVYGTVLGTDDENNNNNNKDEQQLPKFLSVIFFIFGCLAILRAVAGTYSVHEDAMGRLGMLVSAYLSTAMSVVFFVGSMVAVGMRHSIAPYLSHHQSALHLSSSLKIGSFLKHHVHFPWTMLLIGCVVEVIRWISMVHYREFLLEEDELSIQIVPSPLRSRNNRKPWWWKRNSNSNSNIMEDELGDPLLGPSWADTMNRSYQMDEGLEPQRSSVWSSLFGTKRGDHGGNARDDGSVDFASVQEDWASRSEEDPFWWSRDEGGGRQSS
eukprot:CAMPEP_0119010470 /NCGR_PEP_ID=MMETSP1176-20130426/5032_1 /TAXON_ID=265551 /ORGANISM="Synedropsis recta cf, Strain CCMP1620" /LENGTH=354 /DNA_ID=CAMNT_0006963137 /DNA_START=111 /DNA_END=1175 /DNA_ORIENTATION=-